MLRIYSYWAWTLALLISAGVVLAAESYTLRAGDIAQISVYGQPDLSSERRVSESGTISFPLLGEVKVAGLTEREAENKIAKLLENGQFVRSPQVSLIVADYQGLRASVLGHVAKPGVYPLRTGNTLLDLIAEAGGLTDQAGDTVVLTKATAAGDDERVLIDLPAALQGDSPGAGIEIKGGDRIFVPRMNRFYIYGQVNSPAMYRLERGMTVMQAISVAGGFTDKAKQSGLLIKRAGPNGEETVTIEADLMQPVEADDVIFVKESLF